ncbi:hypothetical protein DFH09DRAFT_544174 [Mycena vulgaris]|nr:hypothetical protein DFH09DRAFT_544174 [Mycena vulgaris]
MNGLIASGSLLMYAMVFCFGVGLVDFFWQLYPALSMRIVTTCGIYGSGPLLSSFGQRASFKVPVAFRDSWQYARMWTAGGSAGGRERTEGRPSDNDVLVPSM